MADKQLSALTAASALSTADLFLVSQSGNSRKATGAQVAALRTFRGCLVKMSADATAVNATAGYTVPFDGADEYDTDSIHDPASNNTRLTVPSGVTKVKVIGAVNISGGTLTAGNYINLRFLKNGSSTFVGNPIAWNEVTFGNNGITITSPVLAVSATDYFELQLFTESDTSITVESDFTWFTMEIIE